MRQFLNKPSGTFGSHCVAAAARRCTWALTAPYGLGASAPVKPEAVSLLWALAPLPLLSWLICGPSAWEVFGPEPHQGPSRAMASCLCALTSCIALGSLTSLLLPGLWPLRTGTSCIPRAARRPSASAWGMMMSLGDVVREPLWASVLCPLFCAKLRQLGRGEGLAACWSEMLQRRAEAWLTAQPPVLPRWKCLRESENWRAPCPCASWSSWEVLMFEVRSVYVCSIVATFCPEMADSHSFYKAVVEVYKVTYREVGWLF